HPQDFLDGLFGVKTSSTDFHRPSTGIFRRSFQVKNTVHKDFYAVLTSLRPTPYRIFTHLAARHNCRARIKDGLFGDGSTSQRKGQRPMA
ncbi:MAG: hypothetical protein Q4D28_01355, partial [Prevotellaceae bacterium]|nr:hypothetical protein [Prevotellaceae bacterium]